MADQDEKTKQESVYIPQSIADFVEQLAEHGIIGKKKGAIYRHLIVEGVQRVIDDEIVDKTLKARESLVAATKAKKKGD